MAIYKLHPEAQAELTEAACHYLQKASPKIAGQFIDAIDEAIGEITSSPSRWPVVEKSQIRRYVVARFPFVIYYGWVADENLVIIYSMMHGRRKPGGWKRRLE